MNDQISVPRELLERIVGKCKLSVLGDDHAKVWELLSAPAVEVEGLEVVAWQDAENPAYVTSEIRIMEEWVLDGYPIVPLCSMPKAQAIIEHLQETIASFEEGSERMAIKGIEMRLELDQQAARIKELEKLLVRTRVCLSLDDTEWGHTATEKYALLADIRASVKGAHDE